MTTRINEFANKLRSVSIPLQVHFIGIVFCIVCGIALASISVLSFASQHKNIPAGILTTACTVAYAVAIPIFIQRFKTAIRCDKIKRHASYLSELATRLKYALSDEHRAYFVINDVLYLAGADPDDEFVISFFCVDATGELLHFNMRAELCPGIEYLDPDSEECDYSIFDELFKNVYYRTKNEALSCLIDSIALE